MIIKYLKLFAIIGLQIISVFIIPMFFTFFSEWLNSTGFFNDSPCEMGTRCGVIDRSVEWGIRHHLYFWMCFFLFCLNLVRAIVMIGAYINNEIGIE